MIKMNRMEGVPENLIQLLRNLRANGVPEEQFPSHIERFLEYKSRVFGIPAKGTFELFPLCNLDCKMCYVHLNREQLGTVEVLAVSQWKYIMRQAHEAGMRKASLTGGECLAYPGFEELYLYLQNMGVSITVLTNGLLLNEERIRFLKENPVKEIQISLYGSNDDTYEKVTGKRCFEQVYNNILAAKDAGLKLSLAITPNQFVDEDLESLISLAHKTGIKYSINVALCQPRENTGRCVEDLSLDRYVELYKWQALLENGKIETIDPMELPDFKRDGSTQFGLRCGGGRSGFHISWDGKMAPCVNLADLGRTVLNRPFLDVWKEINEIAENFPVPLECPGCVYENNCPMCGAEHREIPGHCNLSVCERTKRFVQEGVLQLS